MGVNWVTWSSWHCCWWHRKFVFLIYLFAIGNVKYYMLLCLNKILVLLFTYMSINESMIYIYTMYLPIYVYGSYISSRIYIFVNTSINHSICLTTQLSIWVLNSYFDSYLSLFAYPSNYLSISLFTSLTSNLSITTSQRTKKKEKKKNKRKGTTSERNLLPTRNFLETFVFLGWEEVEEDNRLTHIFLEWAQTPEISKRA